MSEPTERVEWGIEVLGSKVIHDPTFTEDFVRTLVDEVRLGVTCRIVCRVVTEWEEPSS
jgi:hypothetical protein